MTSVRLPFATPTERLATYFDTDQPRVAFEDREIDDVALLLEQCGHIASKCPRTYILLRTIGHLDTIDRLVKVGFSDQLFPVEPRSLPSFLEPSVKSAVVQHQSIILTKSLDLENGRHRHFAPEEVLPFDILGRLGSGGYGQVDRIRSKTSYRQFALKRIRRRAAFGNTSSREALRGFLNEMKIMRGLEHRHIVQYIGSYTDKSYLGLVMSPVAETDLATYTEALCAQYLTTQPERSPSPFYFQTQPPAVEMVANLRTFFGCLTAALAYLHDQNIRHKDIKPQNILVSKDNVLFSDFGLSRDFGDDVGSTTSGITPASARYCAPEVATYEARNTSSDIWSLGCVFLEMSAAMHGMNVSGIKTFFDNSSSQGTHYHANPAATTQMIRELENVGDRRYRRPLTWIEKMVLVDRVARPTAAQVLDMITMPEASDQDESPNMFCGICCVPYLESDSMDSLADDFDNITAVLRRNSSLKKENRREIQSQTPELPPADTPKTITPVKHPLPPERETLARPKATERDSHEHVQPFAPPQIITSSSSSFAHYNLQPKEKSPAVRGHDDARPSSGRDASIRPPKLSTNPFLKSRVTTATNPQIGDKLSSGISPSPTTKISRDTVPPKSTMNLGDNRHKVEVNSPPSGDVPAELVVVVDAAEPSTSDVQTAKSRSDRVHGSNTLDSRKVFGEPLSTSIAYAFYELRNFKTIGGSYLNGPIPLVVAKFCDFVRNDLPHDLLDATLVVPHPDVLDKMLIQTFDNHDFGRLHRWEASKHIYSKLIFQRFMSLLPEAIIPNYAVDSIGHTRLRVMAHSSKVKILQETIFNIPEPHRLLTLYLLDFFSYASTLHPRFKSVAIDIYCRPFILSPNLALHRLRLEEYKLIFDFLISNADEVLGGKFRGLVIPYSESPFAVSKNLLSAESLDRPNAPREIDESTPSIENSPVDVADSTQNPVQNEDSSKNLAEDENSIQNLAKIEDPETVEMKSAFVMQLRKSGVGEVQIAKYQDHVMAYIHSTKSPSVYPPRVVFGVPIWISTCYASVKRSAYEDFNIDVRLVLEVPIVVAECCQQVHRAASRSGGYDFAVPENSHDKIIKIAEIFNSFPAYGETHKWRSHSSSLFGAVLFLYLRGLPEPLIPDHAAKRLLGILLTADTDGSSEAATDMLSALADLPTANCDTLLYLVAFFRKLHVTFDYIAKTVPEFTSFFFNVTPAMPQEMSNIIVKLLIDDMPSILPFISDMRRKKKPATSSRIPLPVNPLYPNLYVTANSDYSGYGNGTISFSRGDKILVLERTNSSSDHWKGECNGERGTFPANYATPLPPGFVENSKHLLRSNSSTSTPSTKPTTDVEIPATSSKPEIYLTANTAFASISKDWLSFTEGARILLLQRTDHVLEAWMGRLNGEKGLFLASYVTLPPGFMEKSEHLIDPGLSSTQALKAYLRQGGIPVPATPPREPIFVTAESDLYSWDMKHLCFKKGDKILLIKRTKDMAGWWKGYHGGKQGIFPANYVTLPDGFVKDSAHLIVDSDVIMPPKPKEPIPGGLPERLPFSRKEETGLRKAFRNIFN